MFPQKRCTPTHRQLAKADFKVKLESEDKHTLLHSNVGTEAWKGWNRHASLSHGTAPHSAHR